MPVVTPRLQLGRFDAAILLAAGVGVVRGTRRRLRRQGRMDEGKNGRPETPAGDEIGSEQVECLVCSKINE